MLLGGVAVGLLLLRRVDTVDADLVLRPVDVENCERVSVGNADYPAGDLVGRGTAVDEKAENKDR